MNRALRTCGTITKDPTFISSESKKERRNSEPQRVFGEKIAENFPNLAKYIGLKIQETEQTQNRKNSKKSRPRHIIIKLLKSKGKVKVFTATKDKRQNTYRGTSI